jgi:hypothetical protein
MFCDESFRQKLVHLHTFRIARGNRKCGCLCAVEAKLGSFDGHQAMMAQS